MTTPSENWGLIGHRWAVDLLSSRIAVGQPGHAYLFTGPPMVGKRTLAIKLAQTMNCTGGQPPCGECRHCDLIARNLHPDVQMIEADGRNIKIDQVRDLQHDLTLRPVEARSRVAVLGNFQDATDQAADALLKTLEEPAPTSHLLLTADNPERLPATIVSRCKTIPLRAVPAEEIAQALGQRFGAESDQANLLARLSGGRPGWATQAFNNPEVLERRMDILNELMSVLRGDRTHRFSYAEEISRNGNLDEVLSTWQSWWRDVLLLTEGSAVSPVNVDRLDDLKAIANHINPEEAWLALRAVRRTIDALAMYANTRLTLEVMLLDMPYLA